jgi:DNA-binding transcriptional regulator YbjK
MIVEGGGTKREGTVGRREDLADAGVRLIARGGIRALTHRSVDEEAGLPAGSTSYYARTRRELRRLVVDRIAEGTQADVDVLPIPARLTRAEVARVASGFLDRLAAREQVQAARFALLFELREDDELRRALTAEAPVRASLDEAAERLLRAAGVAAPAAHAVDLVGLVDALLMYRAARAAPVDAAGVLTAYLAGLPAAEQPRTPARGRPARGADSDRPGSGAAPCPSLPPAAE